MKKFGFEKISEMRVEQFAEVKAEAEKVLAENDG